MPTNLTDYMAIFKAFTDSMDKGLASAQTAGETLVRLAGVYVEYNTHTTAAYKTVARAKGALASKKDEAGKPMTGTAIDKLVDGSPEGEALKDLETHIENIDRLMSSVRHFQQGLSNEYRVAGLQ